MTAQVRRATGQHQPTFSNFADMGCMSDDGLGVPYLSHQQMWNSSRGSANCEGVHHVEPKPCSWGSGSERPITALATEGCVNVNGSSTWKSVHGELGTYASLDEFCPAPQPMHDQIRTYDSLDEFWPAPRAAPGQARTSAARVDFHPDVQITQGQVKVCDDAPDDLDEMRLDPQEALCCNTLRVVSNFLDEPGNVTPKEGFVNSTLHACPNSSDESNSMTCQSQHQASHVASISRTESETCLDEVMALIQSKEQSPTGESYPASSMNTDPTSLRRPTASARTSAKSTAEGPDEITTLMVSNLPRICPPAAVAAEIDRSGFAASFDFVYVPTNFKHGSDKGIAFVNFVSAEEAMRFKLAWKKSRRFQTIGHFKVNVTEARIQGLQANISKWGELALVRVKNPAFRPLLPTV